VVWFSQAGKPLSRSGVPLKIENMAHHEGIRRIHFRNGLEPTRPDANASQKFGVLAELPRHQALHEHRKNARAETVDLRRVKRCSTEGSRRVRVKNPTERLFAGPLDELNPKLHTGGIACLNTNDHFVHDWIHPANGTLRMTARRQVAKFFLMNGPGVLEIPLLNSRRAPITRTIVVPNLGHFCSSLDGRIVVPRPPAKYYGAFSLRKHARRSRTHASGWNRKERLRETDEMRKRPLALLP
jgi:hypothetical protein